MLHPVRMRVVVVLAGSGPMTVHQLQTRLGDVPVATLYRQVRALADGGLIRVVGEQAIRGTTERTYDVDRGQAMLKPADLAGASRDDLARAFSIFAATLIADYEAFIGRSDAAPGEAAWFVTPLDLTDEQFAAFGGALQGVLQGAMTAQPGPGTRRRRLATILIPQPDQGASS
jgi:hypothetical protein